MEAFWSSYVWPLLVMVAESLLLLDYPAHRHRLRAPRRPQDLGGGADQARSERGRAVGLAAVLRRSPQIRVQGAGHSRRRQQGRVPPRPARYLHAGARRLGGDPGQRRLGDIRHQCRRALHLRHLFARRLRRDHGRLGVEFKISIPRRAALRGADGVLRGLDRFRHHHRSACASARSISRRSSRRRTAPGASSAGIGCRFSRCS